MSLHTATNLSTVERRPADFYETPAEVTHALAEAEAERLAKFPTIWEPACGAGAISRVLRGCGHAVIETDLYQRGVGAQLDFYAAERALASAIVTNPPFSEVSATGRCRWQWKAHQLAVDYMALLLPAGWAHAQGCRKLIETWAPAREYKIAWRIDWTGGGSSPANHSWFVWDKSCPGGDAWPTSVLYRRKTGDAAP